MTEATKTILVVDDEPDARDYLTTVLRDNGFTAVAASDGAEAIAMLDRAPPDLVALDITMPETSGVAVYRKLKEAAQLRRIPVIIVTGISEDFRQFISTRRQVPPPEGYITKPVDAEEFVATVRKLVG